MRNFSVRTGVFAVLALASVVSGAAKAENLALVIGNSRYENTTNIRDARDVFDLGDALAEAGYRVQTAENVTREDMRAILGQFGEDAAAADRLVVIFAGHLLTNGRETFLTPTDLESPRPLTLPMDAPALSSILAIAAEHAGGAAVFLGHNVDDSGFLGGGAGFRDIAGLTPGLGPVDVPQGVFLASGPPEPLVEAIESQFLRVENTISRAVAELDEEIAVAGYVSRFSTLAPGRGDTGEVPDESVDEADARQEAYWRIADSQNTIAGYEDFLSRYPSGAYAEMARLRLAEMRGEGPSGDVSNAEQDEIALELSREDRRQIQRDLTILEHDPRGIDGVFGPATRRAVESWQAANDFERTGYLDRAQRDLLREQAERRGAELAEEAQRKAEEEREADIKFWNQTGRSGNEADLRVYLRNYPDGVYAEEARNQLDAIDQAKIEMSRGPEREAWARAEDLNTVEAYRDYLDDYPEGLFAETAKERIAALKNEEADRDMLEAARREEDRLGLGKQGWQLVEKRLAQQGLDPGKVDGIPTDKTRRAIRKYQNSAGLPVTGYLDRTTLSRLVLTIRF